MFRKSCVAAIAIFVGLAGLAAAQPRASISGQWEGTWTNSRGSQGYDWLDTVSHEFVHLVVSKKSRNTVPIWMHEGLAKYLESRWRGPAGGAMTPSTLALLGRRHGGAGASQRVALGRLHLLELLDGF